MYNDFKDNLIKFLTSRVTVVSLVLVFCAFFLTIKLFSLQIINGEKYTDSFQLMIRKERSIPGVRGNIYDRNGNLLAYNELTYSVVIEDVFDSGRGHNKNLNTSVNMMLDILEKSGDSLAVNFSIDLDDNDQFVFNKTGTGQLRFLADIYGHPYIEDLTYPEKTSTAQDVINTLAENFGVGDYADPEDYSTFVPGLGYTNERLLKVIIVRYNMSLTGFQKYLETVIAENVSDATVAEIQENSLNMPGVSIAESTTRKYVDPVYFSQVIGYTGKISQEELNVLSAENPSYDMTDIVGKTGIEQTMDSALQGEKGSEILFVDKMGKVIANGEHVDPLTGNDVYLTLDRDLQKAAYNLLETSFAGIIVQRCKNVRVVPDNLKYTSDLIIPIYDVYYAFFRNYVIDIDHFTSNEASSVERRVHSAFDAKYRTVMTTIENELRTDMTPYNELSLEYKVYQTLITTMLYNDDVIQSDLVDKEDETYIAWTTDEVISLSEFLMYCIEQNWINVTLLEIEDKYADSKQIFDATVDYIMNGLAENTDFSRRLYKYLIDADIVTGRDICDLLIDQNIVTLSAEDLAAWNRGAYDSYTFLIDRIKNLDITPAQLALDPCAGSIVVTDVNTGDVIALVSYPGYDNNKIQTANYYAALHKDYSRPLYNYATQQRTAPGSTFKPVTATAGLCEGIITPSSTYTCTGEFKQIDPSPKCWIYPGGHGSLAVSYAIKHSCNAFFFNVGFDLSIVNGKYNDATGIEKLRYYSDLYGLTEKTGIEINENDPIVSDKDAVRSSIGQGTAGYTTIGLARYVTTIANRGTCYNLTLIDKLTDHQGNLIYENTAGVRNQIEMSSEYWNSIHYGMHLASQNSEYMKEIGVNIACKTGTAEENKNRGDHALFISFAPYENPEISVTVRVAFAYTSGYTSQIGKDLLKWYYHPNERDAIIKPRANELENQIIND